jgi:hypothetical protein
VKLLHHPDFRDVLVTAAEEYGVPEQFVEKDYYVTEALRIVASHFPDQVVFKGGTSLSKGWGLIDRFSEDVDLFLNPERFTPALSKRGVDRQMKALRDAIDAHPGLQLLPGESHTLKSLGREDYFEYESVLGEPRLIRPAVKVEPGVQSGDHPVEVVRLTSYAARLLSERGLGDIADDLEPFAMTLLHYRRTFVEKLFTIHGKVERLKMDGSPVGRDTRHYADLHVLARLPNVREMLRTPEYEEIRRDYDEKSRAYFLRSYRPPQNLSFSDSEALFPAGDLRRELGRDYERECRVLFYGPYPSFDEALAGFEEIRRWL